MLSTNHGLPSPPPYIEDSGSAPMTVTEPPEASFRYPPVPVTVPPVPTPATKWVIFPPVCSQISGPVVRTWASGLARLSYWLASQAPGISPVSRVTTLNRCLGSSRATEVVASTTSAPYARRMSDFSADDLSDTPTITRYPRCRPTMVSPMPVFPEVASMIVPPGFSSPSRSAASTMESAARSLTLPPMLRNSALA